MLNGLNIIVYRGLCLNYLKNIKATSFYERVFRLVLYKGLLLDTSGVFNHFSSFRHKPSQLIVGHFTYTGAPSLSHCLLFVN